MARDPRGRRTVSAYLVADEGSLASIVGRRVTVVGRRYWVQGVQHAAVLPRRIYLRR
jgi:hypothetical protein